MQRASSASIRPASGGLAALVVAGCATLLVGGCATTVSRLDGELGTPVAGARNACERQDWLVLAPTRTHYVPEGRKVGRPRDDGVGLYKVGQREPEDLTEQARLLAGSAMLGEHERGVHPAVRDRNIAAGLGAAGVIAIAVGTVLFITAFESSSSTDANGTSQEHHDIVAGRAAAGGVLVGAGFGLGIAGIAISPDATDRAAADAWRYAFLPERDDVNDVRRRVAEHNRAVRERCGGGAGSAPEPASAAEPAASGAPADAPAPHGSDSSDGDAK